MIRFLRVRKCNRQFDDADYTCTYQLGDIVERDGVYVDWSA
jgi:hypothetical protein